MNFFLMLREAKLRERIVPDFVSQGWDERMIRSEHLRQRNVIIESYISDFCTRVPTKEWTVGLLILYGLRHLYVDILILYKMDDTFGFLQI